MNLMAQTRLGQRRKGFPVRMCKCPCVRVRVCHHCVQAGTVAAFRQDPYGCKEPLLDKKLRRDPFAVGPPHPSRCPALKGLLQYCGTTLYEGRLPWV